MERKVMVAAYSCLLAVRPRGVHTWAKSGLIILGPMTPTIT